MKKWKLFGLLIGTLLVGAIGGGWLGAWWSARVLIRMQTAKPSIDMAFNAAQEAEWLAELRLNEPQTVIKDMENTLNIQVGTLAVWDGVAPPDEKTRKARDNWLVPVKVYRESYPADGKNAASINALLMTVPGRSPKSTCKSGVCRLDDLRLAKSNTITNSP
jgi:hypothetical protein